MISRWLAIALSGCCALAAASTSTADARPQIRLVLQLTVDQLRGDLPLRHMQQFGEGGFRYLRDQGVWYSNAQYRHANTETVVGHSSLATGALPGVHGMIGNVWLDQDTGGLVYNVEDPDYALLSADADVDRSSEIDPTQRVATSGGRSPRALRSSTFSDQLAIRYPGTAKIFGVSVKDRGAIPLAGSSGKAFWFSKAAGEFVTSSYYYERYPQWVIDWNAQGKPARYANSEWTLSQPRDRYQRRDQDDKPWETALAGFGRTFPHAWGSDDSKYFTTLLTVSPAGDELTLDFAKTLLLQEQLGQDEIPDYLSVSFSSTDYVGHLFGSSSLEMEDNLLRLDRTLADLFAFVDDQVGLQHTLIVLSADHGGPEAPPYLASLGQDASYIDPDQLSAAKLNKALRAALGVERDLVHTYFHPYVYLDHGAVAEEGLPLAEVQTRLAQLLMQYPDVSHAFTAHDTARGEIGSSDIAQFVAANHHPRRSGDVYVVFRAGSFINDFDGLVVAASHGSVWRYDRHVPMVFAGAGLTGRDIPRPVAPYDIAPSLAYLLGITAPSGASGQALPELVRSQP